MLSLVLGTLTSCNKIDELVIPATETSMTYEFHINYNNTHGYFVVQDTLGNRGEKVYFGIDSTSQGVKVVQFHNEDFDRIFVYRIGKGGVINMKMRDIRNHEYRIRTMAPEIFIGVIW